MMIARLPAVTAAVAWQGAHADVDENVVYNMCGGLATLMDVHYPGRSSGFGSAFFPGTLPSNTLAPRILPRVNT